MMMHVSISLAVILTAAEILMTKTYRIQHRLSSKIVMLPH